MATSGDQSIEQNYENLTERQRLRAAIHYGTMKICQETENKYGMTINQQVVATITETVWRQIESFAVDLEHFAKHGRRSVISPDDVKLLVRRNPCLLKHIKEMHGDQMRGREEPAHKQRKPKKKPPAHTVTSAMEQGQGQLTALEEAPQKPRKVRSLPFHAATSQLSVEQTSMEEEEGAGEGGRRNYLELTLSPSFQIQKAIKADRLEVQGNAWVPLETEPAPSTSSHVDLNQGAEQEELPLLPRRSVAVHGDER